MYILCLFWSFWGVAIGWSLGILPMNQPSCAQRESHLGNMAPEITGTNPIPLFVDPFCRANLMKHPPNETHGFYMEFTHIWDHWFRSCFPYGPWEMGEKKKRWANLRLSKYSLPRCHVSLGLPYDFGNSNFLPRAQGASNMLSGEIHGNPMMEIWVPWKQISTMDPAATSYRGTRRPVNVPDSAELSR